MQVDIYGGFGGKGREKIYPHYFAPGRLLTCILREASSSQGSVAAQTGETSGKIANCSPVFPRAVKTR